MPYKDPEKNRLCKQRRYKETQNLWTRRREAAKQQARDFIRAIKLKSKCPCGESHPACLDFHHRDPSQKEHTAHYMVQYQWPNDKIAEELAKCDIICANCHRKLHAGAALRVTNPNRKPERRPKQR